MYFHFALLLHFDPSIQFVYLRSEVLSHFVPLRLQSWSEQAILDWEHLSVDADGLHLKDTYVLAGYVRGDYKVSLSDNRVPWLQTVCKNNPKFTELSWGIDYWIECCTCSKDLRPASLPNRTMSSKMAALTSCTGRKKEGSSVQWANKLFQLTLYMGYGFQQQASFSLRFQFLV